MMICTDNSLRVVPRMKITIIMGRRKLKCRISLILPDKRTLWKSLHREEARFPRENCLGYTASSSRVLEHRCSYLEVYYYYGRD